MTTEATLMDTGYMMRLSTASGPKSYPERDDFEMEIILKLKCEANSYTQVMSGLPSPLFSAKLIMR